MANGFSIWKHVWSAERALPAVHGVEQMVLRATRRCERDGVQIRDEKRSGRGFPVLPGEHRRGSRVWVQPLQRIARGLPSGIPEHEAAAGRAGNSVGEGTR